MQSSQKLITIRMSSLLLKHGYMIKQTYNMYELISKVWTTIYHQLKGKIEREEVLLAYTGQMWKYQIIHQHL